MRPSTPNPKAKGQEAPEPQAAADADLFYLCNSIRCSSILVVAAVAAAAVAVAAAAVAAAAVAAATGCGYGGLWQSDKKIFRGRDCSSLNKK